MINRLFIILFLCFLMFGQNEEIAINVSYKKISDIQFRELEKFRVFDKTFYFINNRDGKIYVKDNEKSFDVTIENLKALDVVETNYNNRTYIYYSTPSKIIGLFNPTTYANDYGKNVMLAKNNTILAADSYGVISIYNATLSFNGYVKTKYGEHGSFIHGSVSDAFYFLDNKKLNNLIIIPFDLERKTFCSINATQIAVNDLYILGLYNGTLNVYNKSDCSYIVSSYENITSLESWDNNIYALKDNAIFSLEINITKIKKAEEVIKEQKNETKEIANESKTEPFVEEKPEQTKKEQNNFTLYIIAVALLIIILILVAFLIIKKFSKQYGKYKKKRA